MSVLFKDIVSRCKECRSFVETAPGSGLWYCGEGVSSLLLSFGGKECERFAPIAVEEEEKAEQIKTLFSASDLYGIYGANRQKCLFFAPILNEWMVRYSIDTKERIWAFIATIGIESGRLQYLEEIADGSAYEGRKSLGNIYEGDGQRFKGRGLIQITGRTNYERASKAMGVDFLSNPHRVKELPYCVSVSCWWWSESGCNEIADRGDLRAVRKKVNGGYNGYDEFVRLYNRAKEVIR